MEQIGKDGIIWQMFIVHLLCAHYSEFCGYRSCPHKPYNLKKEKKLYFEISDNDKCFMINNWAGHT